MLPEAILATKEVNEKARNVAFDLLVVIGKKMQKGGVIKRSLIDEMDDEMAGDGQSCVYPQILEQLFDPCAEQ